MLFIHDLNKARRPPENLQVPSNHLDRQDLITSFKVEISFFLKIKKVVATHTNNTSLISKLISVEQSYHDDRRLKFKKDYAFTFEESFLSPRLEKDACKRLSCASHFLSAQHKKSRVVVKGNIFLSMQHHRLISYHSDCCRSQALNLSIRPVYLGGKASPAAAPKTPPNKPVKTYHKKKPVHKKPPSKIGIVCIPPCQKLCKPVCRRVDYLLYIIWVYILGQKFGKWPGK